MLRCYQRAGTTVLVKYRTILLTNRQLENLRLIKKIKSSRCTPLWKMIKSKST
ncbi:MAG: hypothetical protein ACE3L7_10265 [Candidatus Pristimantibacillus sp.]